MRRFLKAFIALAAITFTAAAYADPPGRVGRVNYSQGQVSFAPGEAPDQWVQVPLNRPLTAGDRLWADTGSVAELHVGSTALHIGQQTSMDVLNLDDHTAQFRVTQGALVVRVRALADRDVMEIDTPNEAASILRAGLYRVDVTEAGDVSTVTVREGEADVAAGTTAFPLRRDRSRRDRRSSADS